MSNTSADSKWTFQEVMEHAKRQDIPTLVYAGLIDEPFSRFLLKFKHTYKQEHPSQPANYDEVEKYKIMRDMQITTNLRDAVKDGNLAEVAYAVGLPDEQQGYAPYREIEKLRRYVTADMYNTWLWCGSMGSGKSTDMYRKNEYVMEVGETEGLKVVAMTNGKTTHEKYDYHLTKNMLDVMDIIVEHEADIYILSLDEMSTFLTGYGKHLSNVADLAGFVRRCRKMGIIFQAVGHRVTDITPNIRDLPDSLLFYKPNQERTLIYDDAPEDPAEEMNNAEVDLKGLGDAETDFDTNDFAPWSFRGLDVWTEIIEEREVSSLEEFREVYPEVKEDYISEEDEEKQDEWEGAQCIGRKKDGSRCGVEHGINGHLGPYGCCYPAHEEQAVIVKNEGVEPHEVSDEEWAELTEKYEDEMEEYSLE